MSASRIALFTILLLFLLHSCQKEDLPNAGGELLQKIKYNSNDSVLYTFFYYDDQNKLVAITDSNNNGHLWKTHIEYNIQDKPVKFKVFYRSHPGGSFSEGVDSLVYNTQWQVMKELYTSSFIPTYKVINTYSYDAQGRLAVDTMHNYRSDEVNGYTNFIYDGSNNVVQWQQFIKEGGAMKSSGIVVANYNTHKNPFHVLGLAVYFLRRPDISPNMLLSRYNPLQIIYNSSYNQNYSYEYYSNGLPKKTVVRTKDGGPFSVTDIEFFYQ